MQIMPVTSAPPGHSVPELTDPVMQGSAGVSLYQGKGRVMVNGHSITIPRNTLARKIVI